MVAIPLKEKYRNPNFKVRNDKFYWDPEGGTKIWFASKNRPNPGSPVNGRIAGMAPKHRKTTKSIRPRRRSYGPF